MTRKTGDLNPTRFQCYLYDSSPTGPQYKGVKFGKAIAYKEFGQKAAALRWLNGSFRKTLPRTMHIKEYDLICGAYIGSGGGQWEANNEATWA
jgi:hypothetical protein